MTSESSYLRGIQADLPCLDLTQLADRIKCVSLKFKASGVDFDKPCGRTADNASHCWITLHLALLNDAVRDVSMSILEHAPGVFTLNCVPTAKPNYKNPENTLLESVTLVYLLLKEHRCVTRLHVAESAVLYCCFPALLSKALLQSSGLEQVRVHVSGVRGVWRHTRALAILSCALAKLSLRLDVLDFNGLKPTDESVEAITEALRRGTLRRLVMATESAGRLFRAVEHSSYLRELDIQGRAIVNVVSLSNALKSNKTLRKLTLKGLGNETIGALFKSLKDNSTLEELALYYSYPSNRSLREGFQELRSNRGLKCLKFVEVRLTDSHAVIIADILLENNALREVCLSHTDITDRGAHSIAKSLLHNSTLKRLEMSHCLLTSDSLSSFVESLTSNTTVDCVRLDVYVEETWTPTSALTANVCGRLDVAWNTRGLQDWAASLLRGHRFPRLCVACSITPAKSTGVVQWFDAVRASGAALTELVFRCPSIIARECGKAVMSFLENTTSLKRLTLELAYLGEDDGSCGYMTAFIWGLARNTSVSEAKFCQSLRGASEVKALQKLMLTNRTLHRLEFNGLYRNEHVVRSLERALKDNFVLLSFDLKHRPGFSMHPIMTILNRNQSLLNRAVACVLYSSTEKESIQALRFLSTADSLLDAVADVSGKEREECRNLVRKAVRRLWGMCTEPVAPRCGSERKELAGSAQQPSHGRSRVGLLAVLRNVACKFRRRKLCQ